MVYKIIYTEEAEKDLDAIYQFLHTAYKSEETAKNTIKMIVTAIDKLDTFPDGRSSYRLDPRYKAIYPGSYQVIFDIDEERQTVTIVRILPSIYVH